MRQHYLSLLIHKATCFDPSVGHLHKFYESVAEDTTLMGYDATTVGDRILKFRSSVVSSSSSIDGSFENESTLSHNVGIRSPMGTASHVPEELSPDLFLH